MGSTRPDIASDASPGGSPGEDGAGAFEPPYWAQEQWDVVVIGGGNAGLVSALMASDLGARVLLIERSPPHMRGGNTRHTRNIRCVHERSDRAEAYEFAELWSDLCGVGDGPNDEELASLTIRESESIPQWMSAHGVRWQAPLRGTLHLNRSNTFFLGGGKALVNTYYRELERRRETGVVYNAKVEDLELDGMTCNAVIVSFEGRRYRVATNAAVCASGGFESNIEWLRHYWGDAVDNYIIRGTPFNDGHILGRLYAAGAARAGQENSFHAVAVDARAPHFDGGIATRLDAIPFGVVVNKMGRRFYDEGEDMWPKRYAMWGGHIARQPGQIAFCFWDAKTDGLFLPPMYGATSANGIQELATALGLPPGTVTETITEYNDTVIPGQIFDPDRLDECHTKSLTPPKSHWAQRLDTPPYHAIAMRPGITFTYLGVAIDKQARVRREDGSVFGNVFAAGEIMAGNVLSTGYLAGFGLTIGHVWGRRAGTEAVNHGH